MPKASAIRAHRCSVHRIVNDSGGPWHPAPNEDALGTAARFATYAQDPGKIRRAGTELLAALTAADDVRIRVAALGALMRGASQTQARRAWSVAVASTDAPVKRRAAELAPLLRDPPVRPLVALMRDVDSLVVEAACFACGEITWTDARRPRIVTALATAAHHSDALVREAAVAALGAVGDAAGLGAILAACKDQPSVRRRAVLALAPFDGPDVDAALAAALTDSDWQTRQAAEDLA